MSAERKQEQYAAAGVEQAVFATIYHWARCKILTLVEDEDYSFLAPNEDSAFPSSLMSGSGTFFGSG